jgi:hypothetical protein
MRFAVVYEEDMDKERSAGHLDHGNFFRFACEELFQAEEWAREAIKEGPRNKSRVTIYDHTRPTMKYINIDGEPVRIEIPLQARISAEMQSVK